MIFVGLCPIVPMTSVHQQEGVLQPFPNGSTYSFARLDTGEDIFVLRSVRGGRMPGCRVLVSWVVVDGRKKAIGLRDIATLPESYSATPLPDGHARLANSNAGSTAASGHSQHDHIASSPEVEDVSSQWSNQGAIVPFQCSVPPNSIHVSPAAIVTVQHCFLPCLRALLASGPRGAKGSFLCLGVRRSSSATHRIVIMMASCQDAILTLPQFPLSSTPTLTEHAAFSFPVSDEKFVLRVDLNTATWAFDKDVIERALPLRGTCHGLVMEAPAVPTLHCGTLQMWLEGPNFHASERRGLTCPARRLL